MPTGARILETRDVSEGGRLFPPKGGGFHVNGRSPILFVLIALRPLPAYFRPYAPSSATNSCWSSMWCTRAYSFFFWT